jgi:hypothetical protein
MHDDEVPYEWGRYLNKILKAKTSRKNITRWELYGLLLEQNFRCALTGQIMTCDQRGGRVWTNASIDRIKPKNGYVIHNIQLVCHAVNMLRNDIPLDDFKRWCRLVVKYEMEHNTSR